MKNILKNLLLFCLSVLLCALFLCSCGKQNKDPEHTHTFGEWITIKEASPSESGEKERFCSCGEKETVTVPAPVSIGLKYAVNSDGKTCMIIGIGTCTDADVIIPETIDGYTVTTIGNAAFSKCDTMITLTIPSTINTVVGAIAPDAKNLTTIYCNTSSNFGYNRFNESPALKKIVFGGTAVPKKICYGMSNLEEVVMEDTVTSIGDEAFSNCEKLKKISFSENITEIGDLAFNLCVSLKEVVLPEKAQTSEIISFRNVRLLNPSPFRTPSKASLTICSPDVMLWKAYRFPKA